MNKHAVRLMIGLSAAAPVISVHTVQTLAEVAQESEAHEIPTPVLSGPFYDAVRAIDARLEISETSLGIQLTLDVGDRTPSDAEVLTYFWTMVQILNTEAAKEYDSISFFLVGNQTLEALSVSGFNGIHEFTSSFFGPLSKDESVGGMFKACYYVTFGGHDAIAQSSLDMINMGLKGNLPDTAQTGYLWVMSNFPNGTMCTTKDSLISIEMVADNTYEGGKETFKIVNDALSSYIDYLLAEPLLMPYKSVQLTVSDRHNANTTLWDLAMVYADGSWTTIANNATGDFLSGLVDG